MQNYLMPLSPITKKMYEAGKRPLLFHLVPHILYKGLINTENIEVIEV